MTRPAEESRHSVVAEDWLKRLVLRFFEERIFGRMRLDKLAQQLRAHDREQRRNARLTGTRRV